MPERPNKKGSIRVYFIDEIERFVPLCEQEEEDKKWMLAAATAEPERILTRENALMHMTASSMIINETREKVLMAYHNIYNSWAWTGGHADGESDLLACALKEAHEETGIRRLRPIMENAVSLEILHVPSHIKHGKYICPHLHFNLTYALIGSEEDETFIKADENSNVGWLPIDTLDQFVSEKIMLPVYQKIISRMR